jgi:hypothetical protein
VLSLLARDSRRRRRERFRLLPRPSFVEVHRATGAAEAAGDRVVGARRLVRRLERPKPDALIAAANLDVECAVRPRADTALAGARAAAGRHLVAWRSGARWAAERSEAGAAKRHAGRIFRTVGYARAWHFIAHAASLERRTAQKRARGFLACPLEVHAGSPARQIGG